MNHADELRQIMERIEEAMFDAEEVINDYVAEGGSSLVKHRAESYWMAHIDNAINKEDWFSMVATCKEIEDSFPIAEED
jgi:hypothetical protein